MKSFKVTVKRGRFEEVFIACATNEKKLKRELPSFFKHIDIADDIQDVGVVSVRPIKYRGITMFPTEFI